MLRRFTEMIPVWETGAPHLGMIRCRNLTRLKTVRVAMMTLLIIALLLFYTKNQYIPTKAILRADFTEYDFFEPEVLEDFAVNTVGKPLIPHIIHQTYKDENIPEVFVPYVMSFQTKNPSWKYYFWTDESARRFIAERHTSFLSVWDNYLKNINRADALRYFVLYEFGGIYADLDVECLRPLDRVTLKYAAIFPPEPVEHTLRFHTPFWISNAIMMSRPKHPFLKQIIDSISNFQPMADHLDIAGPAFVTTQFMTYNRFKPGDAFKRRKHDDSNSPYFYKGEFREDDINAVYVPNTHYFMHTLSYVNRGRKFYYNMCKIKYNSDDIIVRRTCHEYWLRSTKKDQNRFTFTEHHWYHTYSKNMFIRKLKHISKILRNYTIYS